MIKTLVIIPAYNEAGNIKDLLLKLVEENVDVVVINDFSKDLTSSICKSIGTNVIDLPCNLGIGGAVQTGYKYALNNGYDIAIQIDGDGQHRPEYINQLIEPIIREEADMVIGSRYINKEGFQSTFLRRIGIRYFSILISCFTRKLVTDPTSGFRACNRKIITLFASLYPNDYPEPESIVHLLRTNHRVVEIPVQMLERRNGVSSIKSFKSTYYMIKVSIAIIIDLLRGKSRDEVMQ